MLLRAADGLRGTVFDLDTGRRVPKVFELNLETGYIKAWFVVEQDDQHPEQEKLQRNSSGEARWYEAHGRFRFVPAPAAAPQRQIAVGAPRCALCSSPLTLPGDDLCPRCRAGERSQKNRFLVERLVTPLLDRKCFGCSRLAVWSVSDEVTVSPEQHNRALWSRGMTVGRTWWCDFCYKPGRLLDDKGEVVEQFRYTGP